VLDPRTFAVDEAATAALRAEMRQAEAADGAA
jgi:hypothetical protein